MIDQNEIEELRARRIALGLSQRELCRLAGLSTWSVYAIETGVKKRPNKAEISAIREALDRTTPKAPIPDTDALRRMVEEERKARGLTYAALGRMAGLSARGSSVSNIIRGQRDGSRESWRALLRALGLDEGVLSEEPASRPGPAAETIPLASTLARRRFIPGRVYVFSMKNREKVKTVYGMNMREMEFIRDTVRSGAAVHHIFRHASGYIETFTDSQCIDYEIEEAKR